MRYKMIFLVGMQLFCPFFIFFYFYFFTFNLGYFKDWKALLFYTADYSFVKILIIVYSTGKE